MQKWIPTLTCIKIFYIPCQKRKKVEILSQMKIIKSNKRNVSVIKAISTIKTELDFYFFAESDLSKEAVAD